MSMYYPSSPYREIDYKDIGARIREQRLILDLKQERLAEIADLSLTHMSHIETANTKLSLPAFHKLSWALDTSMDQLACDCIPNAKEIFESELLYHTQDCDETEIRIIVDTIKALKASLRKRKQQDK